MAKEFTTTIRNANGVLYARAAVYFCEKEYRIEALKKVRVRAFKKQSTTNN